MNLLNLTGMIRDLNAALDSGKHDAISLSEIKHHVTEGDIIGFIESLEVDLSLIDTAERSEISESLYGLCSAVDESRKWGVRNRGLCLLIAYVNELIQIKFVIKELE